MIHLGDITKIKGDNIPPVDVITFGSPCQDLSIAGKRAALGSLFDGIGGFPYVWAQLHAGRKELCVWASEIEEFPIAVTKKWFAGE
mgnify:CR=1 FL=1